MDDPRVANAIAAFLGIVGGGFVISIGLRDWAHGDAPTVALLLLLGLFFSLFGTGLALFAAVKLGHKLAWLVAGMDSLVVAVSTVALIAL